MPFICEKCGAAFPKNQGLQKHRTRKRPCVLILEREDLPEDKRGNPHRCRYCGRVYSRADSLTRHLKTCKIANSEEGMEKLMEYTLQRQLAEQNRKIDELTALVKQMAASQLALGDTSLRLPGIVAKGAARVNMGPVTNTTTTTTNVVQINI